MNTTLTMDNNMMMMVTSSSSSSITGGGIVPLYLKILASIFYIFSIILGETGSSRSISPIICNVHSGFFFLTNS